MSSSEDELGYFILLESERTKGSTKGWIKAKMDTHTLAYILKGLNCRIGIYERMGPENMAEDDVTSFEYTKLLRDTVEDARNSTLEG